MLKGALVSVWECEVLVRTEGQRDGLEEKHVCWEASALPPCVYRETGCWTISPPSKDSLPVTSAVSNFSGKEAFTCGSVEWAEEGDGEMEGSSGVSMAFPWCRMQGFLGLQEPLMKWAS